MNRPHFNKKERERHFGRRKGICYLCGGFIDTVRDAWEIEHEDPWELSRDNSDANLYLAHVKCHRVKTSVDAGTIAKVKRIEAKHNGTAPKSRTPLRSRGFSKTRLWEPSGNEDSHDNSD